MLFNDEKDFMARLAMQKKVLSNMIAFILLGVKRCHSLTRREKFKSVKYYEIQNWKTADILGS